MLTGVQYVMKADSHIRLTIKNNWFLIIDVSLQLGKPSAKEFQGLLSLG